MNVKINIDFSKLVYDVISLIIFYYIIKFIFFLLNSYYTSEFVTFLSNFSLDFFFLLAFFLPLFAAITIIFLSGSNFFPFYSLIFFFNLFNFLIISLFLSFFLFFFNFSPEWSFNHSAFWFGLEFILNLDTLSVLFIFLSSFLFFLVFLLSFDSILYNVQFFFFFLFILEFLLFNLFFVSEFFFFFYFFEALVLPMLILIALWGSSVRRIYASMKFLFFTLLGSIFSLFSFLFLFFSMYNDFITDFLALNLSPVFQFSLFFSFLVSFFVKLPVVPFHSWLPEAHVEAPTGISVLLAGILLKTAGYGMIKFLLPLTNSILFLLQPWLFSWAVFSIFYSSFIALRQTDLKKIVAYASVAHMGYVLLAFFSLSFSGLAASVYLMIAHGIVSSSLFVLVGILYDRLHTRSLLYISGIGKLMPIFSFFFFLFILGNMSFPSTPGFIAEFLVLCNLSYLNIYISFLSLFGILFAAFYSVWLFNRIINGYISSFFLPSLFDIKYNSSEFIVLCILTIYMFFLGLQPDIVLNIVSMALLETFDYSFLLLT